MVQVIRKAGAGMKNLTAAIQELKGSSVRVGFFDSAKYEDGTPVAYVAAIQEFGSAPQGIPPRPFMRPTVEEKKGEYATLFGNGSKAIMAGNSTATQVMETMGGKISGDIAKTISTLTAPALKKSTVDARKRKMADKKTTGNLTKPLVASAIMVNSVTYEVGGA